MYVIYLHRGRPEAHEPREEALVELAVLLEGHGLDDRGQLVVVSDQDHALQPAPQHRVEVLHAEAGRGSQPRQQRRTVNQQDSQQGGTRIMLMHSSRWVGSIRR